MVANRKKFSMFRKTLSRWLGVSLLWLATGLALPAWVADQITVFAAASATHAIQDLAAMMHGAKPGAQGFLDFLLTPTASKVFRQYGFTVLD